MPWTNDIENTKPPDIGESPRLGASRIRDWKEAVCERLKEIFYGFEPDDSEDDDTKKGIIDLPFHKQASAPSETLDKIKLYAKEVSGVTELFAKDSSGNEKQLTDQGKINLSDEDVVFLTGNQTIAGEKTFSDEATFNGGIDMGKNQAKQFVVENRTSDPASPVAGQAWFRTDV